MRRFVAAVAAATVCSVAAFSAVHMSASNPVDDIIDIETVQGDTLTKIAQQIAPAASAADQAAFARTLAMRNPLDSDPSNDSLTVTLSPKRLLRYLPTDVPGPTTTTTTMGVSTSTSTSTTTEPPPSTTSSTTSTTIADTTSTTSTTTSTTSTTAVPSTTTTPSTTLPPSTACGTSGAVFCEDFSSADPNAWKTRFDFMWSGELHAGSAFGADRNGWPMDHDLSCGNPNQTSHNVFLGGNNNDFGQVNRAAANNAFMACLPGGQASSGHLMTSANTEGYIVAWFSPKPVFTNVKKVCFDINFTFLGNGQWWQLVFLTPDEYNRPVNINGTTVNGDLGYTSPEFHGGAFGGPSTHQGTAFNGVKFMVNDPADGRPINFSSRPWNNNQFNQDFAHDAGPGTSDKAPRYPICVQDNGNNTLTIYNGSPDGTIHSNTMPGNIPDGQIRVVFEHDEYNPDKHHSNNGPVDANHGEGYTWHWDNVQIFT